MINDRLNVGKTLAARVVNADNIGQACHNWHHVLEVLVRFTGTSVDYSAHRAVVSYWSAAVVLKVDQKPVSPIVNRSAELLQPSIAKDEFDGNRIAKVDGDEDAIAITVTVGSPCLHGNGEV